MAEMSEGPGRSGLIKRACDQCRIRKIRCDKDTPCSNCRTGQRECSWTGQAPKPREVRQRVLISHQYERKIDHFESRLVGIEGMLRNLTTSLGRGTAPGPGLDAAPENLRTYTSPSVAESSTAYEEPTPEEDDDQTFEGNSSMTAHAAFARDFLERAVTSTNVGRQVSPDIQHALSSLQQMVHMHSRRDGSRVARFAHQKSMPRGGFSQLPLPPTDVVLKLLREVKMSPPMTFMMSCTFITVEDFVEYCRKVYFATDDYEISVFIIVNTGLYYLFQEKSMGDDSRRDELLKYHYLCRDNVETALANLPLLLPPTKEMVEALLLGVTYSIEISRMTLAWQFNSAAAAMCQTLGWHRLQKIEKGGDTKSACFWFCYMLDKGLSLRFGRTSIMHDWDISMPRQFGNTQLAEPWKNVINVWIRTGSILGEIYELLYSSSALARSQEQRIETAQSLVGKMKDLWNEMEHSSVLLQQQGTGLLEGLTQGPRKDEGHAMTLEMIIKSGKVGHLASLTLIYRAIPNAPGSPSTFNTECLEAARMAFKCHQDCMELTSGSLFAKVGYLHWTVLYSPFTPLIVLFCHVIETSNSEDLQRLEQFTLSLQPAISISLGIEKLHRLCKVLYQVAALYVRTKGQQQLDQDMYVVGNDFDMYLSQLGFISPRQATGGMGDLGLENVTSDNQSLRLGDWFSGNKSVMELMEEEFLDYNPGG